MNTTNTKPNNNNNVSSKIKTWADIIFGDVPEAKPIMAPWLNRGEVAMVWADTGVGKSWFALSTALSAATGLPIGENLGFKPNGKQKVMYLDGELSLRQIMTRARMLHRMIPEASFGEPEGAPEIGFHIRTDSRFPLVSCENDSFKAALNRYQPDLVVIDNAQTVFDIADFNDSNSVGGVLAMLNHEAKSRNIAIVFVHHARKDGQAPNGSVRFSQDVDTVIKLSKPVGVKSGEGLSVELEFTKLRDPQDGWRYWEADQRFTLEAREGWKSIADLSAFEVGTGSPNQKWSDDEIIGKALEFYLENPEGTQNGLARFIPMSPSALSERLKNPELKARVDAARTPDF